MSKDKKEHIHLNVASINQQKPPLDPESFPMLTANGKPMNMPENIEHLLNYYNCTLRFNEIAKEVDHHIPHKIATQAIKDAVAVAEIKRICIKHSVPKVDLKEWMLWISDKYAYNPVKDWITSKPWDGISRIKDFYNTIQCENNALRDIYMRRWMIGAVAIGLSKGGIYHPGVLTFISEQSKGKSAWVDKLAPPELSLILGEFTLDPNDKDSIIRATSHWIVELAEADGTINKSESNSQKSFISKKKDKYRVPYGFSDTTAPRRTCFIGTVNESQFLKDPTGNRRWWVLETKEIDYEHTIDMQQVWAEFYEIYLTGEQFHLNQEEHKIMTEQNKNHRPLTSVEEHIMQRYDWESEYQERPMTALQVLDDCGFDVKSNKYSLSKEANRILQTLCKNKKVKIRGLFHYKMPKMFI